MNGNGKIKFRYIKWLMLASQALLIVFTAQWLFTQYNGQREVLKKNLTKLFTDVQHQISDSLLLTHVIDPLAVSTKAGAGENTIASDKPVTLSPGGLHKVLTRTGSISKAQERDLFHIDTIAFNEIFSQQMRQNGWDFPSQWINNNDSNKEGKSIFIKSNFFTQENGVVVKNYRSYLFYMLLPQLFFALILLTITSTAFWVTYRSLAAQMKLSQLKDDFISNMSHELKTPISTVKLALDALNNYGVIDNPVKNREYLGMASAEMDRLELLATRVLNTSLLDNGKMYLQRETYDLKKLIEEVVQNLQLRLAQSNAKVSFETKGNCFMVPVDKLHMQGVVVNLIDNSLKYALQQPNIYISLNELNGAVQLSLSDNGPGIPEEYRGKIFEKFFRIPDGYRHNTKGYGLGLSYAAQVMRQHNGSINVSNRAAGGCTFTLTF
ncbi:MAG: HAMP domain-containing histidine kinase [Taibaiella sp.]|nr:HAMP domain-containing histidine kinase [Taibaiella sp.]